MYEWIMLFYSALLCIAVHQKRFTIMWGGGYEWMMNDAFFIVLYLMWGGSLLNHHQCAASTSMMRRLPQDNGASALTTHQLQVERRER